MKELIISKNDSGQRLDRFLTKVYPKLSQSLICKLLRKKRIKVNNSRIEQAYKLCENDSIQMYLSDELLEKTVREIDFKGVSDEIEIIYEDENVLLVDKTVGLVVHEDNENSVDTLINRIKSYLYKKGEYSPEDENSFVPALCNRIDRNTGGIVIAAKNSESLRILNQKIHDRELKKLYLCVASGKIEKNEDLMTAYLEKKSDENFVVITSTKTSANKTIKTKYRVIDKCSEFTLAEVDLLTGRTHQIRAHFAYIGHPLMGDGKYGNNKTNKKWGYKYQALYAYKLKFEFETESGILEYLNNRDFEVKNVWFKEKYFNDKLSL